MEGRFLLLLLLATTASGCIDGPDGRTLPVDSDGGTGAGFADTANGTAPSHILWRGNVTGDAAVGWTFHGDGRCALSFAASVSGGYHGPKAGVLYDHGSGFGPLTGSSSVDAAVHAGGQSHQVTHQQWVIRRGEAVDVQDGLRVLVVGLGLTPTGTLRDASLAVDLLCDETVTVGGLVASRQVLVRDADHRGDGPSASVSLVADVNPGDRVEVELDAPEVAFGAYDYRPLHNEVRLAHPDGELTFTASADPPPFRTGGPGHYVLDIQNVSSGLSGFHAYLVGLYPVAHLDHIRDLPALEVGP